MVSDESNLEVLCSLCESPEAMGTKEALGVKKLLMNFLILCCFHILCISTTKQKKSSYFLCSPG